MSFFDYSTTPASNTSINGTGTAGTSSIRLGDDAIRELMADAATFSAMIRPVGGRLTLETGVPVSTSDQTGKATLYFAPYAGNSIWVYASSKWQGLTFAETSLSLSGYTAAKPYDIFGYSNSGTFALESLIWTDDTTRATALTRQDGVLVKSGDATRRYLGTIYTSGTGTTEDSFAKRFVWNYYNRRFRPLKVVEATSTWVYNSSTVRQARGTATNQIDFVRGVSEDGVKCWVHADVGTNGATQRNVHVSIGLDSTTTRTTDATIGWASINSAIAFISVDAQYVGLPSAGRHRLVWLEGTSGSDTNTFYSGNAGDVSGIYGEVMA